MGFLKNFLQRKKLKLEQTPEKSRAQAKPQEAELIKKASEPEKEDGMRAIVPAGKAGKRKKHRAGLKTKIPVMSYGVLKEVHITEKAAGLAKNNQYAFKVYPGVNKIEVKRAVEELYDVDVERVNIIETRPKKRRLGRIQGWRRGYRKAIVKLKQGQKIETLAR